MRKIICINKTFFQHANMVKVLRKMCFSAESFRGSIARRGKDKSGKR